MELHSATTRFALACNQSSKIIEPIQSRCAIVRFMKLSNEEVLKRAKWVAEQEGVAYDAPGLEAITFTADGDMRQALNNLQATAAGFGFVNQVRPCIIYPQCTADNNGESGQQLQHPIDRPLLCWRGYRAISLAESCSA